MIYRHTQHSTFIAFFSIISIIWISRYYSFVELRPYMIGATLFVTAIFFTFFSLTIEIKNGVMLCIFGPGLVRKKIKIKDIQNVHAVINPWYSGWGIHYISEKCWLWNVSGFEAVELRFSRFKRFRVGTNEPTKLLQAIIDNMK